MNQITVNLDHQFIHQIDADTAANRTAPVQTTKQLWQDFLVKKTKKPVNDDFLILLQHIQDIYKPVDKTALQNTLRLE
ncbi:hypothetical protein [Moraxella atlantae]|uniref:Uncharacterized protein n=1 Tax=Faucicola atlantae TaxID=34059 RepID=A0A378Q366_9GAMM|nr:hypothetical protein [Moraxella atlantae]OPH33491.1 hypothetical protein B5J92_09775 [Moraxella atlantae]STY94638.1 Uncharacterised protein [Moraxella atlantae]